MSKRYKFFLILNIVLLSMGSIIFFGRAIYVIASGLAQYDAFPYNPIMQFLLALVCALLVGANIENYKTEKEFCEKLSLFKEKLAQSDNSDMNDINDKDNADSKNDTKASSEHYHNL